MPEPGIPLTGNPVNMPPAHTSYDVQTLAGGGWQSIHIYEGMTLTAAQEVAQEKSGNIAMFPFGLRIIGSDGSRSGIFGGRSDIRIILDIATQRYSGECRLCPVEYPGTGENPEGAYGVVHHECGYGDVPDGASLYASGPAPDQVTSYTRDNVDIGPGLTVYTSDTLWGTVEPEQFKGRVLTEPGMEFFSGLYKVVLPSGDVREYYGQQLSTVKTEFDV